MLRLAYADSGSACKLAQDMVPTAHTQIEVRAQPLESSLGRVPQAADGISHALRLEMGNQCRNTTTGAHFSGSILSRICLRAQPLESSLGRVPQAADGTCK